MTTSLPHPRMVPIYSEFEKMNSISSSATDALGDLEQAMALSVWGTFFGKNKE